MRKLIAALACRANGARLYGKPLQLLDVDRKISILDQLINLIRTEECIEDIVLGVSEGTSNEVFHEVAAAAGVKSIRGDERDVLHRLILCAEAGGGSDVFRVTTESPFPYCEMIGEVWRRHVDNRNDVTVIDGVPEGTHFEIYRLEALRRSHGSGDSRHRSELCSLYVREHRDEFQLEVVPVPSSVQRLDLRLTVDYPEDLVLCRQVYAELANEAPRIPLEKIIAFLDSRPDLAVLVAPYVVPVKLY